MRVNRRTIPWLCSARVGGVLALCGLATGCSAAGHRATPASIPSAQSEQVNDDLPKGLVDAHNAERSRQRLAPLMLNPALTQAAAHHAAEMARRGTMSHRGSGGSSPFDRIQAAGYDAQAAGENVAYGFNDIPTVMLGWMQSRGHRRNILGAFTEIGVGRAVAPGGVSYWCVTFGTPQSASLR